VERHPTTRTHTGFSSNNRRCLVKLTYRLEIRGPLPRMAQEELRRRFGDLEVRSEGARTVVSGLTADQAAPRAVLSMLWDVGSEVRLVQAVTLPSNGEEGVQS
jgi:hypothetical protein